MRYLAPILCLALSLAAQDQPASPVEILAQGPLGVICLGSAPEIPCPFTASSMGWFVHVRSSDGTIIGYSALLKYTDKDGAEHEAVETATVNREVSDTVFLAIRVGPFTSGGNTFVSVEVTPVRAVPEPAPFDSEQPAGPQ